MNSQQVRAAVLLSGGGRTLANILAHIEQGKLDLEISGVVSSRAKVGGVEVAKAAGIPVQVFLKKDYPGTAEHNLAINNWLSTQSPQIIILAGYLCWYQAPPRFTGPVVNIHPALLPRFGGQGYYGQKVHRAVLESGATESGCTVHLVDDQYDHGRILGQQRVPVLPDDDLLALAARVFAAECELYPRVLQKLCQDLRR